MPERPEPDLDHVREALREHDDNSEDPPEHVEEAEEPQDDGDDAPS